MVPSQLPHPLAVPSCLAPALPPLHKPSGDAAVPGDGGALAEAALATRFPGSFLPRDEGKANDDVDADLLAEHHRDSDNADAGTGGHPAKAGKDSDTSSDDGDAGEAADPPPADDDGTGDAVAGAPAVPLPKTWGAMPFADAARHWLSTENALTTRTFHRMKHRLGNCNGAPPPKEALMTVAAIAFAELAAAASDGCEAPPNVLVLTVGPLRAAAFYSVMDTGNDSNTFVVDRSVARCTLTCEADFEPGIRDNLGGNPERLAAACLARPRPKLLRYIIGKEAWYTNLETPNLDADDVDIDKAKDGEAGSDGDAEAAAARRAAYMTGSKDVGVILGIHICDSVMLRGEHKAALRVRTRETQWHGCIERKHVEGMLAALSQLCDQTDTPLVVGDYEDDDDGPNRRRFGAWGGGR